MTIRHYFALGALAAAMTLLPGCVTTPHNAGANADTAADGSGEPDLMQKLRERMASGGHAKHQEKPQEKQEAATADSSKSPTVNVDLAKQQAAAAVAPDYARAIGMMAANKDDEALALFKTIAAKAPTFSGPLVNQGVILIKHEQFAEAEKVLDQAIDINPKNPYAFNMLGVALREQGKFPDAKAAYQTALTLDPNYAKAHFNLAVLEDLYMQDLPAALEHYQRYQALQSTNDKAVTNWIVDLQKRTGTYQAAAPKPAAPAADATAANGATPAPDSKTDAPSAAPATASTAPAPNTPASPAADTKADATPAPAASTTQGTAPANSNNNAQAAAPAPAADSKTEAQPTPANAAPQAATATPASAAGGAGGGAGAAADTKSDAKTDASAAPTAPATSVPTSAAPAQNAPATTAAPAPQGGQS